MKKLIFLFTLLLFCGVVSAQDSLRNNRRPRRIESPESMARSEASKMRREMNLTDKQYDKLYSLFLKENQALIKSREKGNLPIPARGGRGMGKPGGGFDRGNMGRPDGGGFGGSDEMGGPGRGGFDRLANAEKDFGITPEQMEKTRLKKEKKIAKIVGKDKFYKWKETHSIPENRDAVHPKDMEYPE